MSRRDADATARPAVCLNCMLKRSPEASNTISSRLWLDVDRAHAEASPTRLCPTQQPIAPEHTALAQRTGARSGTLAAAHLVGDHAVRAVDRA
jgi:hypothetical protein